MLKPIFSMNITIFIYHVHLKKHFINARNIIGIHSSIHTTKIVFENGSTIEVNIPYTLVTKKWQESLTVGHIIEKTTFY